MSDTQERRKERKEKKVKGQTAPDEVQENISISQKENNETSLNIWCTTPLIVCDDFNNLQDQMHKWTKETLKVPPCHSCPDPCTEKEAKHELVLLHGLPCVILVSGVHKDMFLTSCIQQPCHQFCQFSEESKTWDKAAETVQARRESNEELVKYIVDQKGVEETRKDILSGKAMTHFHFEEKFIVFDDDKQLDKMMKYLSDLLDSYKNMSAEVRNMSSSDRIKYMLNVMLSEASINALENTKALTRAEAVEQIQHGQLEE
ncbi:hypothetical protein ATANTOWER_008557, partial [Ataeniobius toweri]|nr:hypothetical protein [Ataeniobius toweri]